MGGFAVIATQLTDRSARPFTLTVGGVDVLGLNGSSYRTQLESIELNEAGWNGVSSLSFSVWDPQRAFTPTDMAEVEFWDATEDQPLFVGFVQEWTLSTRSIGRTIDIQCVGIEAILDWMVIPEAHAFFPGEEVFTLTQALAGKSTGVGVQLRTMTAATPSTNAPSSQAFPVGGCGDGTESGITIMEGTIAEGTSLREAINAVAAVNRPLLATLDIIPARVTVDFYHGLRLSHIAPSDYDTLAVTDAIPGLPEPAATQLEYTRDALGVVHSVYVQGGNAAGSGLFSDGSGIPGPSASVSAPGSTTTIERDAVGLSYLRSFAVALRGTVDIGPWRPTGSNYRAGSECTVTNAAIGISGESGEIGSVAKRFVKQAAGIAQVWTVAFGAQRASAVRQLRRLTRGTRS